MWRKRTSPPGHFPLGHFPLKKDYPDIFPLPFDGYRTSPLPLKQSGNQTDIGDSFTSQFTEHLNRGVFREGAFAPAPLRGEYFL